MVDNFEQIKSILKFDDKTMFYYIQLLRRAADDSHDENSKLYHGNMHSRSLKNYHWYEASDVDKYENEIKTLCNTNNCRAYIRLNRRSDEKVSIDLYEHIYLCMKSKTFKRPHYLLASACGKGNSEPKATKSWLIDVDAEDMVNLPYIYEAIKLAKSKFEDKLMYEIKSKSGVHLITHPFNKDDYKNFFINKKLVAPSIHEDNPTILYAP